MKKTILSVLLILALSFAFIGCKDPEPDPFPSDFPKGLIKQLESMGVKSFIAPEGGKYQNWEFNEDEELNIAWSGCTRNSLNKYEQALKKAKSTNIPIVTEDNYITVSDHFKSLDFASIAFIDEEYTLNNKTIPAGSILFNAVEKVNN